VSSLVPKSMKLGEVCLSLPAVINRDGIARALPIPLNGSDLEVSADILKRYIAILNSSTAPTA